MDLSFADTPENAIELARQVMMRNFLIIAVLYIISNCNKLLYLGNYSETLRGAYVKRVQLTLFRCGFLHHLHLHFHDVYNLFKRLGSLASSIGYCLVKKLFSFGWILLFKQRFLSF